MTAPPRLAGFLAALPAEAVAAFRVAGRERAYPPGSVLFCEGDRSDHTALILHGRVKITATAPDGTVAVLSVRGPGELVGELAAIDAGGPPRMATVTALERVDARVITASELRALLAAHPEAALALLQTQIRRLRDADRRRVEFGAYDATRRLARLLVELAEEHGVAGDGGVTIALPVSQEELGGLIAASRESVARSLVALRDRGLVGTARRTITVVDLDALRDYAGATP